MYRFIWLRDLKAAVHTWKGLVWLLVTALIFSATSYLFLTNRELSLLDQTEMLWLLSKVIIGAALLVTVIDASSLITSEFENETIESLLLSPLALGGLVLGKLLAALTMWMFVYAAAVPYMVVTAAGSRLTGDFLAYVGLFGTLAVLGFTLLVLGISFFYRSFRNTLTTALVILLALALPALFSPVLKTTVLARIAGAANPLDSIFAGLDNVLVDYHTALVANLGFLLPVLVFCLLALGFLMLAVRAFKRRGIVKD
jgi:ABC-2 type transport system permease protein